MCFLNACQVLPVLSCAGSPAAEGGRPSATLRLRLSGDASAPSAATAASSAAPQRLHGSLAGGGAPPAGLSKDGTSAEPAAEVALRSVTLWLGLPLLARLEAFAEPLLLAAAEAAAAAAQPDAAQTNRQSRRQNSGGQRVSFAADPPERRSSSVRSAVAAAIDSILDDLQAGLPSIAS